MQMIDVLKRLAELDTANPNRPEYKVDSQQNISTAINESTEVAECGIMGSMGPSSSPASITMTAASGDELGDLIRSIASLSQGNQMPQDTPDALSATPAMAIASPDGMDMRAVIDKLNPMDDDDDDVEMDGGDDDQERKADEAYDNTPASATDTNEFDAEQHAHHENPPGAAAGRGLRNHPVANATYESLMAEYKKFISED